MFIMTPLFQLHISIYVFMEKKTEIHWAKWSEWLYVWMMEFQVNAFLVLSIFLMSMHLFILSA